MPSTETNDVPALIAGLLRDQLGLPKTPPRVFIYNTNWNIPKATWMFLLVSLLDAPVYGAGSGYGLDPVTHELTETQEMARSFLVTVDAFSQSTEARERLPEIFFALTGDAAERLSEQKGLRIFRPEQWHDLSQVEASRRLNRWQTQFSVYQSSGRRGPVPYMQVARRPIAPILVQQ